MEPNNPITNAVASLRESEKYSDLQVICHGETFKVHRAVICTQSEYFARIADGNFQEATSGVIDLQEDDPENVARMINFFYLADYSDAPPSTTEVGFSGLESSTVASQLINAQVYALGDKYIITKLKDLAINKFQSHPPYSWQEGLTEILRTTYSTTPSSDRALRNVIVAACCLFGHSCKEVAEALQEVPEAHVDVLKEMLSVKEAALLQERSDTEYWKSRVEQVDEKNRTLEEDICLHEAKQDRLRILMHSLREAMERLRSENEDLERMSDRVDTNEGDLEAWEILIGKVNYGRCRHCRSDYNIFIDESESDWEEGHAVLRCCHCGTRH